MSMFLVVGENDAARNWISFSFNALDASGNIKGRHLGLWPCNRKCSATGKLPVITGARFMFVQHRKNPRKDNLRGNLDKEA